MGQITRPRQPAARQAATFANAIQHFLVEQTPPGHPRLLHEGLSTGCGGAATSFSQAIALGDTFVRRWSRKLPITAGRCARAGPPRAGAVLDVARSPLGPFEETFGRSLLSRACGGGVRGFQCRRATASAPSTGALSGTGKHFAVHGQPEVAKHGPELSELLFAVCSFHVRGGDPRAGLATSCQLHQVDGIPSHPIAVC